MTAKTKRIHKDRVGYREETKGARGIDERRHRDHGVGRVEIAADQEPGNPGAKLASPESPFFEMGEGFGAPPARGAESEGGDEAKQNEEDRERGPIDLSRHRASSGRGSGRQYMSGRMSGAPKAINTNRKKESRRAPASRDYRRGPKHGGERDEKKQPNWAHWRAFPHHQLTLSKADKRNS
jgi:hypothetical protein